MSAKTARREIILKPTSAAQVQTVEGDNDAKYVRT
jgi:hypothetical protein